MVPPGWCIREELLPDPAQDDEDSVYITLDGISKSYATVVAVDRVDISINKNEFVSLLGPSGSGKTTLLRIIAGLERPTTGRVVIDGQDVTELPPHKRGVAMVFQEFLLFPHRTVSENLAFPLRMQKMPKSEIETRIAWATDILSLKGLEGRYPSQLSGGQQQRVALGRGLVARPKVLLLDEPLANLDRELRQEMEVEIRRYQMQLGIPFIYVTHNQEEAMSMSDRIAVVREGNIEDFAERASIYDRPKTAFIAQFVGRSNRFAGTVSATSPSELTIATGSLTLTAPPRSQLAKGQKVLAFIKNEKIKLRQRGGGAPRPNAIDCKVKDVILRGAYGEYILSAAGIAEDIVATRPREQESWEIGAALQAFWESRDVDIFLDGRA